MTGKAVTITGAVNCGDGGRERPVPSGPDKADEVLTFWFGSPGEAGYGAHRDHWFGGGEAFDDAIRRRFSTLHRAATAGELERWRDAPQGCLALILVLDQFSRNLFRGSARAFAADARARDHASYAMAHGYDKAVPPAHRTFFYLPFEHSENLQDQRRAVALYRSCARHRGAEHSLDYAIRHLKVIARFGRFPHRNQVLGRRSMPGEIAFLAETERGY